MFYLKNQIILILVICIFSNLISSLNGKTTDNQDEDTKTDLTNDLTQDNLISRFLKKSYSNDELLNSLMSTDIQWEPVDLEPIELEPTSSLDFGEQSDLSSEQQILSNENKKSTANKKSMNYQLNRSSQPKRNSIYRPIRAQRCLKRGSLCDPSNNPVLGCCSHSVCRCNFFNDQCRCDRMSLLQRWG